jgi:DME family drug/metabolite transporter
VLPGAILRQIAGGGDNLLGYFLAVCAAVLWSLMGVLGKTLYRYGADPLTVVTFRAVVAFVTLFLVLAVINRKLLRIERSDIPFLAVYGLIGVTFNYSCYFYAIRWTTVTTAIILLYTYPAIVTVLAALFLNEKIDRVKIIALLLTFSGCFLVAQGYDLQAFKLNLYGALLGLGAGLSTALYSILGKKALVKYESWTAVLYAFGFGALFLLILRSPLALLQVDYPLPAWGAMLALAWLSTLLGYALFTTSMKYIEASQASITSTLDGLLSVLWAYLFLGENPETFQLLGAALVLMGVIAHR